MIKFLITAFIAFSGLSIYAQAVNEKIMVSLTQAPLLRVYAGSDVNLSEDGTAILGEGLTINGGTPEYSYTWADNSKREFYGPNPQTEASGWYWLTVKDGNNCQATDSMKVLDYGTGMQNEGIRPDISILNNQTEKILSIELVNIKGVVHLTLVNTDGRVLIHQGIELQEITSTHILDLRSCPPGLSVLHIRSKDTSWAEKILIY